MKRVQPCALVILDGFGYSTTQNDNAIAQAQMPHFKYLLATYPWTTLEASGHAVGLVPGMAGNSEVGHLTLGAGRIIKQIVVRIDEAIANKTFFSNPKLTSALKHAQQDNATVHIMGLLSDAYVHGNIEHMFACTDAAVHAGVARIYIHAFLDGRDSLPQSATIFLERLDDYCAGYKQVTIASLQGRFFAMDRNNNWERTEQAYRLLTEQQKLTFSSWRQVLDYYYAQNITDEFIPPTQLCADAFVHDGDGVILTNFRADRARQLVAAFVDGQFCAFVRKRISPLFFLTLADYQVAHDGTTPLFEHQIVTHTLKEILSEHGLHIFSIAETEKYAHVTYFFGGEREEPFLHEKRVLVPSLRVASYADYPRMSADAITKEVVQTIANGECDFYLINYANADMVGHTGNFEATVAAVECLDEQIGILYNEFVIKHDGAVFFVGDNGKAEHMVDAASGQPCTAHTTNQVYFVACARDIDRKEIGQMRGLADVAEVIRKQLIV